MDAPLPQDPSRNPLTASQLLWAYRRGWFPMADPLTGQIEWFSPDPRAIMPLEKFHTPRNLKREVRRGRFEIRCDTAFDEVIRACAAPRRDEDLSWIDEQIIESYVGLYNLAGAHSIEAWLEGRLVGGLYGVHIGGGFFGESMFTRVEFGGDNSSKVCLVHLVRWLRHRGFVLLDTQFHNKHLTQFGCVEVPRRQYLSMLAQTIVLDVTWGRFSLDA